MVKKKKRTKISVEEFQKQMQDPESEVRKLYDQSMARQREERARKEAKSRRTYKPTGDYMKIRFSPFCE